VATASAQVLEDIRDARVEQLEAEAELAALIDHAVDLGIGWPQIAAQLGVTRQAARQQHQRRHRDSSSPPGSRCLSALSLVRTQV
jgi:hypothetical protein